MLTFGLCIYLLICLQTSLNWEWIVHSFAAADFVCLWVLIAAWWCRWNWLELNYNARDRCNEETWHSVHVVVALCVFNHFWTVMDICGIEKFFQASGNLLLVSVFWWDLFKHKKHIEYHQIYPLTLTVCTHILFTDMYIWTLHFTK